MEEENRTDGGVEEQEVGTEEYQGDTETDVKDPECHINVEKIARVAHEVNREYCLILGEKALSWEDAPPNQKKSVIAGVVILMGDTGRTSEQMHESWLEYKEAEGWKYGPVKDEGKKEHPCMVPYGDLPLEQQLKDALFRSIVLGMLN